MKCEIDIDSSVLILLFPKSNSHKGTKETGGTDGVYLC